MAITCYFGKFITGFNPLWLFPYLSSNPPIYTILIRAPLRNLKEFKTLMVEIYLLIIAWGKYGKS